MTGDDPLTIPALAQRSFARFAARTALASKRAGKWIPLTYAELAEAVDVLARGFLARGVAKGDRVAVLLPNSPEWQITDLALLHVGAVTVPIYETLTPEQVAFILADSGAKLLVVAPEKRWRALAPFAAKLPALEAAVLVETESKSDVTLRDLTTAGRKSRDADPALFAATWQRVAPGDLARIVYTSGTTGEPKGVMLSHRALAFNAVTAARVLGVRETDVGLLFLPLAHGLEQTAEMVGFSAGATGYYAEGLDKVRENLLEVRPTIIWAVPRFFDKAHDGIRAKVARASAWRRRAFTWALAQGAAVTAAREQGRAPGATLAARHALARRLFGALHAQLGGNLRFLVSGGAPLSADVARFFFAAGLPIYEGYGLTETGPILALNTPDAWRIGTVGRAFPGVELRLADDAEILARGPGNMQGYWKRAEDTAATIGRDGWLHTGDLGAVDADGFMRVTGRKKELIVKSNGKKVAPEPIERALEATPYVAQAVVLGEGKPYLAALLVPRFDVLRREFKLPDDTTGAEILAAAGTRALVQQCVDEVNAKLANFEQVKTFALLPRELAQETGELTPTLKVKRRAVAHAFAREIAGLFPGA